MSNPTKDNTSIRVHAPPGGHSNNIFGTSEFEQSAANKKKHMQSDIFGSKSENNEPAPAVKKSQNTGNNIFGSDLEEAHSKTETLAGQYKQTQMKSSIFGSDEPTSTRTVSNKNKSDIFGTSNNEDQKKGQAAPRHGHRDPNASRMGYNPINGESYSTKEPVVEKQPEQQPVAENGNAQAEPAPTNDSAQAAPPTNDSAQAAPPANAQKPENANDGNNAQKNVHTSVRVFHPPGGKSNGPLW